MNRENAARDAQLAAEIEADVGKEHVGEVYAEAFLGAAGAAGRTEILIDEFDSFISDVLDRFPAFEEVLTSGLVSHENKLAILDRVLGERASGVFLSFLKVVSGHGRLDCLRAIHRQTHELYDKIRGRIHVRVSTAAPLDDVLARRITDSLRGLLGGQPVLEWIADPDLIGGAVLRIDDTVYDGSIATQLKIMRKQMIDRSVNEIQSRRDRFRYPAGN